MVLCFFLGARDSKNIVAINKPNWQITFASSRGVFYITGILNLSSWGDHYVSIWELIIQLDHYGLIFVVII